MKQRAGFGSPRIHSRARIPTEATRRCTRRCKDPSLLKPKEMVQKQKGTETERHAHGPRQHSEAVTNIGVVTDSPSGLQKSHTHTHTHKHLPQVRHTHTHTMSTLEDALQRSNQRTHFQGHITHEHTNAQTPFLNTPWCHGQRHGPRAGRSLAWPGDPTGVGGGGRVWLPAQPRARSSSI